MYYTINVCVSKCIRLCNIYIKSMSVVQRSFVVNEVLLTKLLIICMCRNRKSTIYQCNLNLSPRFLNKTKFYTKLRRITHFSYKQKGSYLE